MEFRREEILPGVFLTALHTDKFKTAMLSLSLLTQLDAETASMNALIPSVLRRGTVRCPDMDSLAAYMDGCTACAPSPSSAALVRSRHPASTPPSRRTPLPGGERLLEKAARCSANCCWPRTPGRSAAAGYVERERSASPSAYAQGGTTRTPMPSSDS